MKYILTILVFSYLLTACDDSFSTVVEIDPPEFESLLVVGAFLDLQESTSEIYVGRNRSIFENGENEDFKVNDAIITILREDGEFIRSEAGDVFPQFNTNYFIGNPLDFYEVDTDYTFTIEHPDFPMSSTTLRFPKLGQVENVVFVFEDGVDEDGDDSSSITFDIIDEPNVDNFYELSIRTENTNFRLSTIDPSAIEGSSSRNLMFSDETFDGERKSIQVKFDRFSYPEEGGVEINFNWDSVNEGYFNYFKSLNRQQNAQGNPFASTVPVFSNLNNALGTIGLRARNKIDFTP